MPGSDFNQPAPGMMYAAGSGNSYVPVCWYSDLQEMVTPPQPVQRVIYYNILGRNLPASYAESFTVLLKREFAERSLRAGSQGMVDPACSANVSSNIEDGRVVCVVDAVFLVPGRDDVMAIRFKHDAIGRAANGIAPRCPIAEPDLLWLIKRPLIAKVVDAV